MQKEIEFRERYKLAFFKPEWQEPEVDLIRSLNFTIQGNTIICDLNKTAKVSLFEFIKLCFPRLISDAGYKASKDYLYQQLKIRYGELHTEFDKNYIQTLPYHKKLYKHQKEGIYFASMRQFSLLAFEQGTGKTITAASVAMVSNTKKTLIICPSIVKWNWFRDLTSETFRYHQMYFSILDSQKSKCIKAFNEKFIIVNYDMLHKFNPELMKKDIDCIIIDECHALKSLSALRTKNVRELITHFNTARVIMLSGTPVKNRIGDIFAYLKITGHNIGKNHAKFLRDFTFFSKSRFGLRIAGGKNLDTLFNHVSNFMIRKTKEECLDLPDKIVNKYYFELEDYKAEYDLAMEEMAKQRDISNIHSSLHTLNIIVAKSKIKGIIELAESIIEQGRKPIIFAGYNSPLTMLEEHFGSRSVRIDGSVDSFKRDQLITRFKTDDTCEIFLGNMQAAGVGINLTNSSDVILCNFPFTSTDIDQAVDRCHRIGAKNVVNVYLTICKESIDEHLFDMVADKARDINAFINKNNHKFQYSNIQDYLFKKLLQDFKSKNKLTPAEV